MGIKEIFSGNHNKENQLAAVVITENAIKALAIRLEDSLSPDSAADLSIAASNLNKVVIPDITPVQARIAIDQIRSWSEQKLIREESADEAIAKLRPIAERVLKAASNERVFIEVVAQKAREEVLAAMSPRIQKQEELLLGQVHILTRAIYNLETLNALVAEGTWLKEYLHRVDEDADISEGKASLVCGWEGVRSAGAAVTLKDLESFWDSNNWYNNTKVKILADKKRVLSLMLKSIDTYLKSKR